METSIFAAIADAILGFSLISGRIEKSVLTAPMLFVGFGLLMGTEGLGVIDISLESGLVEIVAELTLMLVLFTDASRIDLGMLRREHNVPVRMLAIGLPLCIGAGTGVALLLLPDFTLWEAAVVRLCWHRLMRHWGRRW